ncbi:MAG: LPS-assembly protein LptD [Elusimicrobia bacterium]|nr:LPS-assembly protein LptD [Elusimicrobiota bacterium]
MKTALNEMTFRRRLSVSSLAFWGLSVFLFSPNVDAEDQPVSFTSGTITSDHLEYRPAESLMVAKGHAVLISSQTRLEADEIHIRISSQTATASGKVYMEDERMTLYSDQLDYDWGLSTSLLENGYVQDPPWRLWGRRMRRLGPERFSVQRAAMTSCDLNPPHYHFRAKSMHFLSKKRATTYKTRLAFGTDAVFYVPFYTRSLRDNRWTYTVDPGRSSYHGYYAKSIFTYPLTLNSYGRLYWDHFQLSGNGWGAEYNYFRPDVKGSFYGYRITDRKAKMERWNLRVGHWQQLAARWSLQANALYLSDLDFNNLYFRDDTRRVLQQAESDAAVTYQHPVFTTRMSVEHDRVFNVQKRRFIGQRSALPMATLQTVPLLFGPSVYFTLSGNARHEYVRPGDPINPDFDRFRKSADAAANLSRQFRPSKDVTITPSAGMDETWQSWRAVGGTVDLNDIYQGHGFTGLNFRHRLTRNLDYDLSHSYRVRWAPNSLKRDHASPGANDKGTEANAISLFSSYRLGAGFWARASSGYDLRLLEGEKIKSPRQKIAPPSVEMSYRPTRWMELFHRQTFLLYPVRRPQTGQFSFNAGQREIASFNSGFSYNSGAPGQVQIRHGATFPLTTGWWLDGEVLYTAKGTGKLNYDTVQMDEKRLTVRRDLHCWAARGGFEQRPGVYEFFIRVDIKANVAARQGVASPEERQFYPTRKQEIP